MANSKKNRSAWYPIHDSESNYKNFAYSNLLKTEDSEDAQQTLDIANNLLSTAKSLMSNEVYNQSYSALQSLYRSERQKEVQFIQTYAKLTIDPKTGMVDVIKAMNSIFQDRAMYEEALRNIKTLEKENDKWKGDANEIYALLKWVIPQAIADVTNQFIESYDLQKSDESNIKMFEEKIIVRVMEILEQEIQKVGKDESSVNSDVYNIIQKLDNSQREQFVREILQAYGLSTKALLEDYNDAIKKNTKRRSFDKAKFKKSVTAAANKGQGNAFEQLYKLILNEVSGAFSNIPGNENVKVTVHQTGQMGNMKADQLIYIGEVGIDTEQAAEVFQEAAKEVRKDTSSQRLQNIEGLDSMLKNIDQGIKAVVEISDKNYKLTGEAFADNARYGRGFAAETPTLSSLEQSLSKSNLSANLDDLIFILKNSGEEMINGNDTEGACNAIALNIAHFLFDDVNVTDMLDDQKQSLSRIHLFNLGGIIIPLSVFLEGAYNAFSNNQQRLSDYVDVVFHNHKAEPNDDSNEQLTRDDWIRFNTEKMKSKVAIHFFGDFVNFIQQYL